MPIISKVGKKSLKAKALVLVIYVLLSLGALTMVYPFVLMIAGSTKSTVDQKEMRVIPSFLNDDVALYRKHIEAMFNERLDYMKTAYDKEIPTFEKVAPPNYVSEKLINDIKEAEQDIEKFRIELQRPDLEPKEKEKAESRLESTIRLKELLIDEIALSNEDYAQAIRAGTAELAPQPAQPNNELANEWKEFVKSATPPSYSYDTGHSSVFATRSAQPLLLRDFIETLKVEFDGDIAKVNDELGTYFVDWTTVVLRASPHMLRREKLLLNPVAQRTRTFRESQDEWYRYYTSIQGVYKSMYLKTQHSRDIENYNKNHETDYASYDEVFLPRRYPTDAPELVRNEWERFVRETVNLLWINPDPEAVVEYREFLKAKYLTVKTLNNLYKKQYSSFEEVQLPPTLAQGLVLSDWDAFVQSWKDPQTDKMHKLPIDKVAIDSLDFQWQDHLAAKFGSIEQINQAMGTDYASIAAIKLPMWDVHYVDFLQHQDDLKWEFATRNYRMVFNYMALQGRALWNTVIYCTLAILSALIVNPMAAYAMSRFRLPTTYTILLFLMLTMAFPPMVTQIPVFLMLRNLGLLNTFAALILPGLANGYAIFILKGFFDSQPRELYESASLDGANEWTIFWQICMNLSKPVLAYIALQAFTAAYSNFLFALLICQDKDMWTLMPMLFQLQQRSHEGITFASLIIAAVPTFLVFLFAQNIIMKGIVVPVEK